MGIFRIRKRKEFWKKQGWSAMGIDIIDRDVNPVPVPGYYPKLGTGIKLPGYWISITWSGSEYPSYPVTPGKIEYPDRVLFF
jgi:hypothetical protein